MKHTTFAMLAGIIFAAMAVIHLLRIVQGWDLMIGDVFIPLWASWAGVIGGGILGAYGISLGMRHRSFIRT